MHMVFKVCCKDGCGDDDVIRIGVWCYKDGVWCHKDGGVVS